MAKSLHVYLLYLSMESSPIQFQLSIYHHKDSVTKRFPGLLKRAQTKNK